MRAGRASRTAQHNALFRALESARPADRRLFEDPLASACLGPGLGLVARLGCAPALGWLPAWLIDRRWPGVRSSVVARTRWIDRAVERALQAEPLPQVVILGAGFDSRPYRLAPLRSRRVFEVDHPDTQAAKRSALARAGIVPPPHVRFVAVDFARDALPAALGEVGFDATDPALLLWEGVSHYLLEEAFETTLGWCAGTARGSLLIFTYVHRDVVDAPGSFEGATRLHASLSRVGERIRFAARPDEMRARLRAHGLELEVDIGCEEYRALAYGKKARSMRGHEFYRVALARVGSGRLRSRD